MPIPDLVREYLVVEKNMLLSAEERSAKLIALLARIEELRPLIDPILLVGRYRPSHGT